MSDDEADPELLELLRQSLGISKRPTDEVSSDTGVLHDAEYIYNNSIDVSIDMLGTKAAAASLYAIMKQRGYSMQAWSQHDLHPTPEEGFSEVEIMNFVFTMDLLNFSFWSDLPEDQRYQVEYQGKRWTGYKSLVACLRRALHEGVPITTPRFWTEDGCSDEVLRRVFRSATEQEIPLLDERIGMLREAGDILVESFGHPNEETMEEVGDDGNDKRPAIVTPNLQIGIDSGTESKGAETVATTNAAAAPPLVDADAQPRQMQTEGTLDPEGKKEFEEEKVKPANQQMPLMDARTQIKPDLSVVRLIEKADRSAGKLVNLLAKHFPSFRDEARFDGKRVRLLKRAQIFVADLWAAFNGRGYGEFEDIEHLTMFADYRVPQMLRSLGVLVYSPPLHYAISSLKEIAPGHSWEVQLRGCSIWAVELIRREIVSQHPEAEEGEATGVNAVLIDFLLYDLAKEREAAAQEPPSPPSVVRFMQEPT